jgi:hypothetical protein
MSTAIKRNRFVVDEALEKTKETSFRITRNDVDLLDLLQPYKYLPSSYIEAFLDLHPIYLKHRLTVLRHVAKVITIPPSSWHAANARYRPAVYQLTDKGRAVLADKGRARRVFATNEDFAHEFGVCLTAASFAIGAREHPALNYYDHEAILASKHCPMNTRLSKTPFQIPITFKYHYEVRGQARHKELETYVKHDRMPFGFINASNPKAQMFFPGVEFDRATESLESEDYAATVISKKVQAIEALAKEDGYYAHFGIPNAFIPWVTINEARMRSLMRIVEKVTKGNGSKRHLFTHMPDFASFDAFPPADGSMLTRNWKRVGFDDLNILAELGVK